MVEVDTGSCCMVVVMSEQTSSDEDFERLMRAGDALREAPGRKERRGAYG